MVSFANEVAEAIRDGVMPRPDTVACIKCGEPAAEYHHRSYAPGMGLVVIPGCLTCHAGIHCARFADPSTGQFWCKTCRSSEGCGHPRGAMSERAAAARAERGPKEDPLNARLNIPIPSERLAEYKLRAKRAGCSTLAEYVRRVMDGYEKVEPPKEEPQEGP